MNSRTPLRACLGHVWPLWCLLVFGCDPAAEKNGPNEAAESGRQKTASTRPVNKPPIAVIVGEDVTQRLNGAPREFEFSASESSDPDGKVVSYQWEFGDGTPTDSGETVRHSFDELGRYDVTLTITDEQGATATSQRPFLADGKAPIITSIEPVRYHVKSSGTIWVRGHNLGRVVVVTLSSADRPPLYQKLLGRNSEEEVITEFDFYQAKPGKRSVTVTDQYGRTSTLADAFHLVSKQETAGKGG